MTRVLHTADTHIGYRQYNRPERRGDFLDAFERVVADAVDDDVDAVVHAGDLFHDRRPDLQDLLGTLSALRRLSAAGIPFLAVVGNHESKRDAQWLDLFASLGLAERLDRQPRRVGDVALYGLDFVSRSRRDDLDYGFDPADAEYAALVAHGQFAPLAPAASDWDVRDVLSASPVAFDAVLLGDEHPPGMDEIEGTWVTYAGSTERTSTDERDDRGYNVVAFGDDVGISRRGIPTRPFVFVDVTLGPGEGVDRVLEQVGQHDLEDAVVAVTIDGGGDDDGDRVPPAAVEEFAHDREALVARVSDRREFQEAATPEVRFADPDEAVRERVRELGLSEAARTIDRVVREGTIADSNVREAVVDRVTDALEAPGALPSAGDATGTTPTDTQGDTDGSAPAEPPDGTGIAAPDGDPTAGDGESSTGGQATWGEFE